MFFFRFCCHTAINPNSNSNSNSNSNTPPNKRSPNNDPSLININNNISASSIINNINTEEKHESEPHSPNHPQDEDLVSPIISPHHRRRISRAYSHISISKRNLDGHDFDDFNSPQPTRSPNVLIRALSDKNTHTDGQVTSNNNNKEEQTNGKPESVLADKFVGYWRC